MLVIHAKILSLHLHNWLVSAHWLQVINWVFLLNDNNVYMYPTNVYDSVVGLTFLTIVLIENLNSSNSFACNMNRCSYVRIYKLKWIVCMHINPFVKCHEIVFVCVENFVEIYEAAILINISLSSWINDLWISECFAIWNLNCLKKSNFFCKFKCASVQKRVLRSTTPVQSIFFFKKHSTTKVGVIKFKLWHDSNANI